MLTEYRYTVASRYAVILGVMRSSPPQFLSINLEERFMAKGQDSKKAVKKKPEKTLKEKRAEKKEKKANK